MTSECLPKTANDALPRPPFILSWLGSLSRRTPYFRGKWRIIDKLFHHWIKHRDWSQTVAISPVLQMRCNLWDEIQHDIWWCGDSYEFRESRFLKRLLQPGMVFLDVGANVGYYSLLAATRIAPGGAVHAFEPVAAQHAALCANLRLNHLEHVTVNRLIVSETRGTMEIHIGDHDNSGVASVGIAGSGNSKTETVDAISLDDYIREQRLPKVDVVKIDVEGHEPNVLRGALVLLRTFRPMLLLEVKDRLLRQTGSSAAQVYDLLAREGYTPYAAGTDGHPHRVAPATDGNLIIFSPTNELVFSAAPSVT